VLSRVVLFTALCIVGTTGAVVQISSVADFHAAAWGRKMSAVVLFHASWARKSCRRPRAAFQVASELTEPEVDAVFAEVDAVTVPEVAKNFSIKTFPTIILFAHVHSARVIAYDGHSYESQEIRAFVANTLDHHKRYSASEVRALQFRASEASNHPHPNPGRVVQLTSENQFRFIASDPAKTVVVAFTAPWCQYCKELMPTLEQLASYFEDNHKTVIATFNGDLDLSLMASMKIEGYPTIRVFPKGAHAKGRGLTWRGGRDLQALQVMVDAQNQNVPIPGVKHPFDLEAED
jgi:thioredoxin-like negative regulator of GroEL